MRVERSEVRFGRTVIHYQVSRSDQRNTVSLIVEPGGAVQLVAPEGVPLERLDRVVHTKAKWIVGRQRQVKELVPPPAREFVSGETHLYLGRQYRLQVVQQRREQSWCRLEYGRLRIGIAPAEDAEQAKRVREVLAGWYRRHAELRLPDRVAHWSKKLSVRVPRVLLRDQQGRWGSSHPRGIVRLNWRIIQAPPRLIDYVVAHELVHLGTPNHGPAFWAKVGHVLPDYEERREELRQLGGKLVW